MGLGQLLGAVHRREHEAARLLEMADEKQCDELAISNKIADTRVAEIRILDAEDDLVENGFIIVEEALRQSQ
jgi:uncharacterized Fe-S cluster-containing radical SAM superfamily protein